MNRFLRVAFLFIGALSVCSVLAAQTGEASLSGTILSEPGTPLSGASVKVSAATLTRTAVTDKNGKFRLQLPPMKYALHVELSGFRTTDQDVTVPESGLDLPLVMQFLPLEESVVITASKTQTPVIDSPVSVSVLTENTITSSPAQNYGDLLRPLPGVSVVQLSARDVNITSRGSATFLADSQLALIDGRTLYQDFFGFILWDVLPIDFSEIKQVEVVRGPASAIWGANALSGVINIITKSPLEMLGTSITLSGGFFDRNVEGASDTSAGGIFHASVTHAQKLTDKFSYKLSMGYFDQDPFARPVGTVPVDPVRGTGGAIYPPFENRGSSQPKLDMNVEQELENGGKLNYSGGVGGTNGIINSGIGPFAINNKTYMGYGKVTYSKDNMKVNFFANFLDGDATNLLTTGVDGNPIHISFTSQTYDGEFGDSILAGGHQIITFGGNLRRENFNLSVAPEGKNRTEGGGYVQDDIFFKHFRFVLGGRLDKFSVIENPVFSPRVTFMVKPTEDHTIRFSVNRGFRSPSLVENFVDLPVVGATLDLGLIDPRLQGQVLPLVTSVLGNPSLKEQSQTSYEIGYTGRRAGTGWGASFYVTDSHDVIDQGVSSVYTADNLPPGWPPFLPPEILTELAAQGIVFPASFTYQNLGSDRDKGLELSFNQAVTTWANMYVNYAYQWDPVLLSGGSALASTLNSPAHHRFNTGVNVNRSRYLGSLTISYVSGAFWADVLDAPFHGPTKPYTMANVDFGVRWRGGKLVTSVKIINLTNEQIQEHIFADIIKRSVIGEIKLNL